MFAARFFLTVLGASLLLAGCHHAAPDPTPAAQAAGITGRLLVFDQQPTQQALPRADVTVAVLGTTPLVATTTNAAGEFALPHLPAGTYNLVFSRPGLSSFYLRGIAHPVADQPTALAETYLLYTEPDVQATGLRVGAPAAGQVAVEVDLRSPQPTQLLRYTLYVSDLPTVSFATSPVVQQVATGGNTPITTATSSLNLTRAELLQAGVSAAPGTPLYAVAYGTGLYSMTYTDPATGQRATWPSNNQQPSPVVSFRMP